uniref:Secreted protein n=1 Tax=Rhizophora mucronata TaxID=61149 RepID=A0A2P2J2P5_RHIMU
MMKKKTTAMMMMMMMSTVMTWTAVMVIRTSGVATLAAVDNNIVDNIDCNKSGTGICNSNISATSSITENTASSISGNLDKLGNGKARRNSSVGK